jgi:enoyl-CoA hydratase
LSFEDLIIEKKEKLQIIVLNRPKALNALRKKTFLELRKALNIFADDSELLALIITGSGDRAFSAGGDIKEMRKMTSKEAMRFGLLTHNVLDTMENLQKPVLAAVNGLALGAGCDLAIACDLCIASERAIFGEPPPGIGILTPFGGTQRLPRIIGPKRAKYLFFTGETLDADTALQIGLLNKVTRHEDLLRETKKLADKILTKAPIAVRFSKKLIDASMRVPIKKGDKLEVELYARCFETQDRKEGMNAFIEKRKPLFKGR